MKRILIALALVLSMQVANAQVKSPAAVKKAVEAAEAALDIEGLVEEALAGIERIRIDHD